MSKTKQKDLADEPNLWPEEDEAIKALEEGRDQVKEFNSAEELIADLHKHRKEANS